MRMRNFDEQELQTIGWLNKEDLANEIINLRNEGKTIKEITIIVGFNNHKTLNNFCKKNDIDMRYTKKCVECDTEFRTSWFKSVVCSDECNKAYRAKISQELRKERKGITKKNCLFCQTEFVARTITHKFCCVGCRKKYTGNKRNILKRVNGEYDETITLYEVYCKDDGICYLCHEPINWDDKEPAYKTMVCGPKYPTIEHVIPLNKGGTHTWDNVRLSCRHCNERKSTMLLEDYLAKIDKFG